MKPFLLILFWSFLLCSCKEVTFKTAQPAGIEVLKEVPPGLRGVYQLIDPNTGDFADSLIIESWGYHMKDKKDVDWLSRGTLSDTLVLKFYENYYFVNFKTDDQWVLRVIRQNPDKSIDYMAIDLQDEKHGDERLKKIAKTLKIKEIKRKEDTFYQINPTRKQLMNLIKSGVFSKARMNKVK
ncbi:MAG: hypothetical protein JST43_11250 [Bacteroidetes bacterium]|nr:hypothetical protein [Bacteroidota bacterium]MBS1540040.1 hypothetical protein [Bacteroidota bacterium]